MSIRASINDTTLKISNEVDIPLSVVVYQLPGVIKATITEQILIVIDGNSELSLD